MEEECVWPSNNSKTEKLLIDQKCIQCSTCDSTFWWQSGLIAHCKSMHTGKVKCDQCHWSFRSTEKIEEHIGYLHEKNIDWSNTEEELDTDESDETEDLNKEKLDQLPVKQKPKCHKCGWSFITNDNTRTHTSIIQKTNWMKRTLTCQIPKRNWIQMKMMKRKTWLKRSLTSCQ